MSVLRRHNWIHPLKPSKSLDMPMKLKTKYPKKGKMFRPSQHCSPTPSSVAERSRHSHHHRPNRLPTAVLIPFLLPSRSILLAKIQQNAHTQKKTLGRLIGVISIYMPLPVNTTRSAMLDRHAKRKKKKKSFRHTYNEMK